MVEGGTQGPLPLHPLPPHRELVPQVKYGGKANTKTRFTREPPITFAIGDQAGMTLQTGISLQDALDEKFVGLVDRDEGMFIGCRCTAISLRLQVCTSLIIVPLSTISLVPFTVARVRTLD